MREYAAVVSVGVVPLLVKINPAYLSHERRCTNCRYE